MKRCTIRHDTLQTVVGYIQALTQAGFKSMWTLKKSQGQWIATSNSPIAYSLDQLQRTMA